MSTIIVVDDDEMNVGLTKMLLEMEGFEVVTCLDIDEARAAATQAVQGFIIDYHLNHTVTGIDLIQSIRSNEFEANQNAVNNNKKESPQWRRMDLHLHTPGSSDYQEPHVTYLDILRQAMIRGLDIVAFTDHNTVAGFAAMKEEIQKLLLLEELGRIEPDEQHRLEEYRRILDKLLVLPGFEFTATFGFHILGLFPPETPVSYLEHLLLTLNIPPDQLRLGSSTVGATTDVLTAYRVINEAGGIVIAAHANSNHGVVMRGLDIGGQTRIAYTQDPNLHVLEVTDLEKRGRYTTRRFFDGSKPEYPRPMRCIQGSDAHRLTRESNTNRNLGVGDRVTEILLDEVSFDSLADVLKGNDLSRTRPYRGPAKAVDYVLFAREEGESIVQSFHESMAQRGGYFDGILRDICAMANTNGGTIYVGLSAKTDTKPVGIRDPKRAVSRLEAQIENRFSPVPQVTIDTLPTQGTKVVRITVNPGPDIPYAIDSNLFYVRDEAETTLAVRDEIVQLVEKHFVANPSAEAPAARQRSRPRCRPPAAATDRANHASNRRAPVSKSSTERRAKAPSTTASKICATATSSKT